MEKLYDVNEVAELLRISRWTVRKWLSDKKINAVRLGRRVLFESAEINRLIESGRQPAQTA